MIRKPEYTDAPSYCHYFFDLVKSDDLIGELQYAQQKTLQLIRSIPESKSDYRYAIDKWSVKEVLRHIIDCERVYTYRAFRFSRFDDTELSGFDENNYILFTEDIDVTLDDIAAEYKAVRDATIRLFAPMTKEMLDFKGMANKVGFTARGLGFMAVGHNIHHCNFLRTRYL